MVCLKIKGAPQLRNIPCAIFVLGYSCPIHETCYHGNLRTVLAVNFYIAMKLGEPTQFDMLKMIKAIPQCRNTPCANSRDQALVPSPQNTLSW